MLKDNIFQIIKSNEKNKTVDRVQNKLRGELKVWGYEGGDLIHFDEGNNIVTDWAKHALSHLITGDPFIEPTDLDTYQWGPRQIAAKRKKNDSSTIPIDNIQPDGDYHTQTTNYDGTLMSGDQYFSNNPETYNYWVNSNLSATGVDTDTPEGFNKTLPLFPTKMLFGTGEEIRYHDSTNFSGAGVEDPSIQLPLDSDTNGAAFKSFLEGEGFNPLSDYFISDESQTILELDSAYNNYSSIFDGTSLVKTRTVNQFLQEQLDSYNDTRMFAIKGAVKNSGFWVKNAVASGTTGEHGNNIIERVGNDFFPSSVYKGIGQPAFIYMKRNSRNYDAASEISLSSDLVTTSENLSTSMVLNPQKGETKMTFTVVMPEQTGAYEGEFYPYNGYTLKNAALYADAPLLIGDTTESDYFISIQDQPEVYNMYRRMPFGLMFSARSISPILKSPTRTIVFSWTLYF